MGISHSWRERGGETEEQKPKVSTIFTGYGAGVRYPPCDHFTAGNFRSSERRLATDRAIHVEHVCRKSAKSPFLSSVSHNNGNNPLHYLALSLIAASMAQLGRYIIVSC